jgi:hypothetical protein
MAIRHPATQKGAGSKRGGKSVRGEREGGKEKKEVMEREGGLVASAQGEIRRYLAQYAVRK